MSLRASRPLDIFFDVDGTLISWSFKLRPHVHDVFARLVEDRHRIHIWSGIGLRDDIVKKYALDQYISGLYVKPIEDFRERLHRYTPIVPDFVVDDDHEIVAVLGGIQVQNPEDVSGADREMWRVYEAIQHWQPRASADGPIERTGS